MGAKSELIEGVEIVAIRGTYAMGDAKSARRLASAAARDPRIPEEVRARAEALHRHLGIDPQALAIGIFAVALALVYIGLFL